MKIRKLLIVLGFLSSFVSVAFCAGSKNLVPRMPEFVIERGYSDSFQVVECIANVQIYNDVAETQTTVVLKNITEKKIESAIKIRILYLVSEQMVQLLVNGKPRGYDKKNPRILFSLEPGQQIEFKLKAKQNIQYNLDIFKEEKTKNIPLQPDKKEKGFSFGDLSRFFERENFGHRFMIGPLVSKWGIFPVDFKHVKIDITVPSNFFAILQNDKIWKKQEKGNGTVFSFEGTEGFAGATFLPKSEIDQQKFAPQPTPQGITISSQSISSD